MADVKTIQTRLQLKYDTYTNWTDETQTGLGANLVLLKGEIGICEIPSGSSEATTAPTVLFKVGDGTNPFKSLKWASALAADVYGWAKASDVRLTNKAIEFVGGQDAEGKDIIVKSIPLNYATPEEVAAAVKVVADDLDDLTTRVAAVEALFGEGEGTVDKQLEDLDSRLDALENTESGVVATAKAYTDEKIGTAAVGTEGSEGYVAATGIRKEIADAQAAAVASANEYTDGKVEEIDGDISAVAGRLDVLEGDGEGSVAKAVADAVADVEDYADQAEADAVEAAKEYTDEVIGVKAEGEAPATGIRKEIAEAEAAAKAYTDTAVETQATVDAAQDTEIAKKLDKTTYETYIAGKEMSDADLKKYAEDEADAAESAAIAAAKTETEKQVKALADGQVETNRAAIAAMDEAYKAADEALDGRLDTVEAKLANVSNVMDFIGAREVSVVDGAIVVTPVDEETFNKGDVVVDSNGKEYVYDGSVWREFGYADANASAISGLLTRMGEAEGDIDDLEAAAAGLRTDVDAKLATADFNTWKTTHEDDHAKTATEITAEITAAVNGEKALREAADKAINDKIGTLPTGEGAYATLVDGIADAKAAGSAAAGRLDVVEPAVETLQSIVKGYTGEGSIKTAVDAAAELAQKGVDDAKKAQDEVDALELVVNNEETGLAATKAIADQNKADIAALTGEGGRLTVAEGEIDALQDIVNSGEGKTIRDDVTALQALTSDASKGNEALRSELTTLQGIVNNETTGLAATKAIADEAKSDAEDAQSRVAAIEADYLKSTDLFIFNCGSSTTNVHKQPAAN